MPYGSELEIRFEGEGLMATMMSNTSFSNTVTAVSTDPIPADKFTVPVGYKSKNK